MHRMERVVAAVACLSGILASSQLGVARMPSVVFAASTTTAQGGQVDGLVVTQDAFGGTWSLAGKVMDLWTLDSNQGIVYEIAETQVAVDNSFEFDNVPTGNIYWVEMNGIDHSLQGSPCSTPAVFSVAESEVTQVTLTCTR